MLIPFNELFKRYEIEAPGVLHLGANTGQEAKAYADLGIKRVIWVEAHPTVYIALLKNVAAYPGSTALCACVSDRDDEQVTFNVASNGGQSSSILRFGTHATEHPDTVFTNHIKMKTSRVDSLLAQHELEVGPGWFLNVDLQGAELLALRGMGDLLYQFDHAYVEVNQAELYQDCPLERDIDNYLAEFGFVGRMSKMMKQGWGDKYYMRREEC